MSNSSGTLWKAVVLEQLTVITREKQFAFDQVALSMQKFCTENSVDIPFTSITPEECRRQFSASYLGTDEPEVCDARSDTAIAVDEFLQTNYTFDEAMEFAEKLQADSYARQESIFTRVFESLEGEGGFVGGGEVSVPIAPDVLAAWNERKSRSEREAQQKLKLKLEQEERIFLDAQRERLLHRFDPDSEDAQGVDPLARSTRRAGSATGADADDKSNHSEDSFEDDLDSKFMTDNDLYLQNNFKIHDFVNSDEFEVILEVLEKELASQPDGKTEGGEGSKKDSTESSELGDVLKYLDTMSAISASRARDEDEADEPLQGFSLPFPMQTKPKISNSNKDIDSDNSNRVDGSGDDTSNSVLMPPVPPVETKNVQLKTNENNQAIEQEKPYVPRPRKVIETILDDEDSDSSGDESGPAIKRRNRNWKSSRALLKATPAELTKGDAAASVGAVKETSWGAGGQETANTAAGLLLRQKQEKCKWK